MKIFIEKINDVVKSAFEELGYDKETGKIKIGSARIIRNSLPNATYIGFTGTPISTKDKSTREVFGN